MKKRQLQILKLILENGGYSLKELIDEFNVSRRTIYYDIDSINYEIKKYGIIDKLNKKFVYVGSNDVYENYNLTPHIYYDAQDRQRYIIDKIMLGEFSTIDETSVDLDVSKTTIVNDLKYIKDNLALADINLVYDKHYNLKAEEYKIRDFYNGSVYLDQEILKYKDERIIEINDKGKLYLTDYSIALLSKYIKFVDIRISKDCFISKNKIFDDVTNFEYYDVVKSILNFNNENETKHFVALIASMTNFKNKNINKNIEEFVDELIANFEKVAMVVITNKEEFKSDISRHLQSSYYRLKYKFPIYNSVFEDIKKNYEYLLEFVREAIKNTKNEIFSNMRDSEIAFLTMYFGSRMDSFTNVRNKVVIVCPNGKVVSKLIESQLNNYLPTLDVEAVASINELEKLEGKYDYIISTTPIEEYKNVLIVNPILTQHNLAELYNIFLDVNSIINEENIDNIIEIIRMNAEIHDEKELRNSLLEYFIKDKKVKESDAFISLSNLINPDRVKINKEANSWQDAIRMASQILIDKNSITEKYVDDMIEQVETFGPYIVLVEGVAMPHATNNNTVRKVDLSIMKLEKPVDLKGKMVDLFIVISTIDNKKHLKMISTLSEIISDEESLNLLRTGNYEKIKYVIEKYEKEGK